MTPADERRELVRAMAEIDELMTAAVHSAWMLARGENEPPDVRVWDRLARSDSYLKAARAEAELGGLADGSE